MRKNILLCILFLFLTGSWWSQQKKLDSLIRILPTKHDTVKSQYLSGVSRYIESNDPTRALVLGDSAYNYAKKQGNKFWMGVAADRMGSSLCTLGKYDEAIAKLLEGIKLAEAAGSKKLILNIYNTIGNSYMGMKNETKAYEYFLKAHTLASQEPRDEFMMSVTGIGVGNMLVEQKKFKEAKSYFISGEQFFHKIGNVANEGHCLTTLGQIFAMDSDYVSAERCFRRVDTLFRSINEEYGLSQTLQNLGEIEEHKGNYAAAIKCYEEALALNQKRKAWDNIQSTALRLSKLKEKLKQPQAALVYYKLHMQFKDSVVNTERNKAVADAESKYESEKKEQQLKLKNSELERSQLKVDQRNHLIYFFAVALLVFVILLFFVFRMFTQKKKANTVLHAKNDEIEKQKGLIEEKNKDITDSINYSRHIQHAILPTERKVKFLLKNCFVIYKPKDIVSGDFYLVEEVVGLTYIAVVDCTGHGVPGAMLSVFANSTIKNTIASNDFRENPAAVLSDLCFQFKSNLVTDQSSISDGVDMSLCMLDKRNKKLYFAGARNNLLMWRDGVITEYAADRWGISGANRAEHLFFTNHVIDVLPGDKFYLCTDGYSDQFGGPKGKKLKHKQLKEFIQNYATLPFSEQEQLLSDEFEKWKGKLEQIDDVTLIGFEI